MISIYSNIKKNMPNTPQNSLWHWLTPILISIAVTGGGIAMFAGGLNARMIEVESKNAKFDDRLQRIGDKLDNLATKDDLREFKQDVKERIATKGK
jgi:hypothetical protein